MKFIIDCNVLIAAGLKDGLCRRVIEESLSRGILYISKEIILEYLLVSRRDKFKSRQAYLEELIELLTKAANIVDPPSSSFDLPDPQDKKYIDLAIVIKADFLVMGNLKHFPDKKYGKTDVVSPREFFEFLSSFSSKSRL